MSSFIFLPEPEVRFHLPEAAPESVRFPVLPSIYSPDLQIHLPVPEPEYTALPDFHHYSPL